MKLQTLRSTAPMAPTQRPQMVQPGSWRTEGMSSTARGYGYAWQKARDGHLRSHPLCAMCDAEGKVTAATVVDHRIPHRGDQALFWDRANWQSLCASHHSGAKQREENGNDSHREGGGGF